MQEVDHVDSLLISLQLLRLLLAESGTFGILSISKRTDPSVRATKRGGSQLACR